MLGCNETITLYHAVFDKENRRDIWTEQVIRGCSWYSKLQIAPTEKGVKSANEFRVRIPLENAPAELIMSKGDYIVKGNKQLSDITPACIMEQYDEYFMILSYTVNKECGDYSKHIRIQGAS